VAVSATSRRIVWLPKGSAPYYLTDLGASWTQSIGAPSYDCNTGHFYRSTDGAATFESISTIPSLGWRQQVVEAAPGMNGEVWMSNGASGLYRSSNAGETFAKVANVHTAFMFSFGAPPNGSKVPTVFLYGTVENATGIFRSHDMGTSWILINDTQYQMSDRVNGAGAMAGDR
jgi:hypothetical protein